MSLDWLEEEARAGCVERSFLLRRHGGTAPGVLWSPETTGRPPVVLLFHGGSGHKRNERNSRMGRWLAASAGIAAIAIDGPHHGDRVSAPMSPAVYQQLIADEGIEHVTARMTKDWLDAVSAIAVQGFVDDAKVSVFGMSMGARFGVPVAAALGSRVRCGVFGKFGLRQTEALHPGLCAPGPDGDSRAGRFRAGAVSRAVGRCDLSQGRAVRTVRCAGFPGQAPVRQVRRACRDPSRRRGVVVGVPKARDNRRPRS